MPVRLDRSSADFDARFAQFLAAKREVSADVEASARAIVDDVAARGDAALIEATQKFDRLTLEAKNLRIGAAEIEAAVKACDATTLDALKFARDRIETFHKRQLPRDERFTDADGVELGWRWSAVEAVGLYVPGGTAAYPSSVLMNAVPAKVAGVSRLVMVVPSPDGKLNPLVLAAASLGGVSEIYRVGGAQAIAALAHGTATIPPVAKIVGPGNAYVAAAKRLVFGKVGIDMIAGPSEVLVIADDSGNPDWIAADLLAQAEHDESAQSILITNSPAVRRRCRAGGRGAIEDTAPGKDRGCVLGRFRRDHPGEDSRRRCAAGGCHCRRASGDHDRGCGGILQENPQCRRDFPGAPYPGSDRRLCRRFQPCAADRALGAVFVGPRRA